MNTIRRGYIYIAAFISLQVAVWAIIFLLRNLFAPAQNQSDLAWQLALIVVALPLFVGHWIWGQRLVQRSEEERTALLRRLYLLAAVSSFLGPLMAQVYFALDVLLQQVAGIDLTGTFGPTQAEILRESLLAAVVLAVLGGYHFWLFRRERRETPETAGQAVIRRLYQWGFTIAGLVMMLIGLSEILRWMIDQLAGTPLDLEPGGIVTELARVLVGGVVWLLFWMHNQRQMAGNVADEHASALRKLFLYAVVFVGLLLAVANLAAMWATLLQRWFGESVPGELSDVLPQILIGGVLFAYHIWILGRDIRLASYVRQQVMIRQIYQYLTAAIGLMAFLVGIGGLIGVLINTLAGDPVNRVEVADFLAAITAGLPVWLWPWWQVQKNVLAGEPGELPESGSLVRRVYLYAFVLMATLTILTSGVYLVYRLFLLLFGQQADPRAGKDLALAAAYGLLGLGIWLYHGRLLRADGRRLDRMRAAQLGTVKVVVLNPAGTEFAAPLTAEIRRLLPDVVLQPVELAADGESPPAEEAEPASAELAAVQSADIIVGPWTIGLAEAGGSGMIAAVGASSAQKVLVPIPRSGWAWAGVDEDDPAAIAKDAARLVEQLAVSESGIRQRRWGVGNIIAVVIGAIVLITIVIPILIGLASLLFF